MTGNGFVVVRCDVITAVPRLEVSWSDGVQCCFNRALDGWAWARERGTAGWRGSGVSARPPAVCRGVRRGWGWTPASDTVAASGVERVHQRCNEETSLSLSHVEFSCITSMIDLQRGKRYYKSR